jgi:hypothetical protein
MALKMADSAETSLLVDFLLSDVMSHLKKMVLMSEVVQLQETIFDNAQHGCKFT